MFDFSQWHKGHTIAIVPYGGTVLVCCDECRVAAEIEAISGKISAADTYKTIAAERVLNGQLTAGVPFAGVKQ